MGEVVAASSLYETAPIGGPEQGPYLNAVIAVRTSLDARALLDRCLQVEAEAGRERGERFGPRVLDIDVLVHGRAPIDEPGLTVPHPRLAQRRFVLKPLLEAWPGVVIPGHINAAGLLAGVGEQEMERMMGPGWVARKAPGRPV